MKKTILSGMIFALILSSHIPSFAFNSINENDNIFYNKNLNVWPKEENKNDISLIKKISEGTGSYSIYYYDINTPAFILSSNYEFIDNNNLIGIDNANLKYNKIIYKDSKFIEQPLTIEELKNIFKNAEIIKISAFKNNKIKIKKPLFKTKEILLVNNTDKYFHKYFINPEKNGNKNIKGLITLDKKFKKVEFSHPSGDKLIIYTR